MELKLISKDGDLKGNLYRFVWKSPKRSKYNGGKKSEKVNSKSRFFDNSREANVMTSRSVISKKSCDIIAYMFVLKV